MALEICLDRIYGFLEYNANIVYIPMYFSYSLSEKISFHHVVLEQPKSWLTTHFL